MIEKELLYWMLALIFILAMWLLVLKHELNLTRILKKDADKLAKYYRALYLSRDK